MIDNIEQLIRQAVRAELGLGFQPANRIVLDVEGGATEQGDRYCWGVFNHDRQAFVPNMANAIVGYIEGVGVKVGSYKGKPTYKLALQLDCGAYGRYSVRAGLQSSFSKGLLNAIAALGPAQARNAVKIVVRPGDDSSGKVVLPSLYADAGQGLKWVRPAYDFPQNLDEVRAIYRAVVAVVPEVKFGESGQQAQAA